MLDNYLYINRDECGNFLISADYAGRRFYKKRFMFYTKQEAIKKFRQDNGLTGKHLIKIEY